MFRRTVDPVCNWEPGHWGLNPPSGDFYKDPELESESNSGLDFWRLTRWDLDQAFVQLGLLWSDSGNNHQNVC